MATFWNKLSFIHPKFLATKKRTFQNHENWFISVCNLATESQNYAFLPVFLILIISHVPLLMPLDLHSVVCDSSEWWNLSKQAQILISSLQHVPSSTYGTCSQPFRRLLEVIDWFLFVSKWEKDSSSLLILNECMKESLSFLPLVTQKFQPPQTIQTWSIVDHIMCKLKLIMEFLWFHWIKSIILTNWHYLFCVVCQYDKRRISVIFHFFFP